MARWTNWRGAASKGELCTHLCIAHLSARLCWGGSRHHAPVLPSEHHDLQPRPAGGCGGRGGPSAGSCGGAPAPAAHAWPLILGVSAAGLVAAAVLAAATTVALLHARRRRQRSSDGLAGMWLLPQCTLLGRDSAVGSKANCHFAVSSVCMCEECHKDLNASAQPCSPAAGFLADALLRSKSFQTALLRPLASCPTADAKDAEDPSLHCSTSTECVKRVSVESAPARATKSCSPHISPHVSGGDTTMLPHELWRLRWLGPLHDEQARLCARCMVFDCLC